MRQAVMEFDALDTNGRDTDSGERGDGELDFYEFSRLIREREMGIHSEKALRERFNILDADHSGAVDLTEFIIFALRDAFVRSAANLEDLFNEWDEDGNGVVDPDEFRNVVRLYGFTADNSIIDDVFANLDYRKQGVLEMRDLAERLQQEVKERSRPLHPLRCLAWRDQAQLDVVDSSQVKLDEKAPIGEQIMTVLRAQSARVMDLFRSWDTDGNGLISKQEFRECAIVLGFTEVSRADVDAVFDDLDKDGGGEIEYMEMKAAIEPPAKQADAKEEFDPLLLKGWSAVEKRAAAISLSDRSRGATVVKGVRLSPEFDIISQLAHGIASNWGKLVWLFESWDVDRDGTISRREIRRALAELGLEAHPKAIDAFFDAMDADRSGEVSFDEFQLAIRASLRAAQSERLRLAASTGAQQAAARPVSSVSSIYAHSTEPSPRNRVGRLGKLKTVRQRVHKPPPPPSPQVLAVPQPYGQQNRNAPLAVQQRNASGQSALIRPTFSPPARIARPQLRTAATSSLYQTVAQAKAELLSAEAEWFSEWQATMHGSLPPTHERNKSSAWPK